MKREGSWTLKYKVIMTPEKILNIIEYFLGLILKHTHTQPPKPYFLSHNPPPQGKNEADTPKGYLKPFPIPIRKSEKLTTC